MPNTYDIAKSYVDVGMSVIPIKPDGSKAPSIDEWTPFKHRLPTDNELHKWFDRNGVGIGIVGGEVSGNLGRLDFDRPGAFKEYLRLATELGHAALVKRLVAVRTPRDRSCYHLYFRCTGPVGKNGALAQYYKGEKEDGSPDLGVIVEVKAEGGYTVAPGSPAACHETGRTYEVAHGDLADIPVITEEERDILYDLGRAMQEWFPKKPQGGKKPSEKSDTPSGLQPGEDYNARGPWRELIQSHGWTLVRTQGELEFWRRPGKNQGLSATFNYEGGNCFYVFTSSAYPLEQEASYYPFGLYATLVHNGDYAAAAAQLAQEGYGDDPGSFVIAEKKIDRATKRAPEVEETDEEAEPTPESLTLATLIPPDSFLEKYIDFASKLTDAPKAFHLAVGLSIIGTALGNNVYVDAWGQKVFPHLWVLLLAPSGFYRKTTAISIGMRVLRGECPEMVLPDDFTKEKLIEGLSSRSHGIIPAYEFKDLLMNMQKEYNKGTQEMLTSLFDGNTYRRSTRKEDVTINNPAVGILSASTVEWLQDAVTDSNKAGGFLARFLYWPAREKNGWMGMSPPMDVSFMAHLQTHVRWLADTMDGRIELPKDIHDAYDTWLHAHEDEVMNRRLPEIVMSFYTRIATAVLKLTIIYQVCIDSTTCLTMEALGYAIRLAEYLKTFICQIIDEEMITTRDAKEIKKVLDAIRREPDIDRSRLIRNTHMLARRLDEILTTLIESGQIRATKEETATKPKITFKAVK